MTRASGPLKDTFFWANYHCRLSVQGPRGPEGPVGNKGSTGIKVSTAINEKYLVLKVPYNTKFTSLPVCYQSVNELP